MSYHISSHVTANFGLNILSTITKNPLRDFKHLLYHSMVLKCQLNFSHQSFEHERLYLYLVLRSGALRCRFSPAPRPGKCIVQQHGLTLAFSVPENKQLQPSPIAHIHFTGHLLSHTHTCSETHSRHFSDITHDFTPLCQYCNDATSTRCFKNLNIYKRVVQTSWWYY